MVPLGEVGGLGRGGASVYVSYLHCSLLVTLTKANAVLQEFHLRSMLENVTRVVIQCHSVYRPSSHQRFATSPNRLKPDLCCRMTVHKLSIRMLRRQIYPQRKLSYATE